MHSLKLYRKKYKITQHELAKMLKVHSNHLSAIEIGSRTPSTRLCSIIQQLTNNEVTFNDLIHPVNFPDTVPTSASVPDDTLGGHGFIVAD